MKSIRINNVRLRVRDKQKQLRFYRDTLGLDVADKGQVVELSPEGAVDPLIVLEVDPNASPRRRTSTGLFHQALRFPTRRTLALVFKRLYELQYPFEGFADHGVSEAIYTADPEGNGVELYWDKPREQWPFQNGQIAMVTDPLDLENLTGELHTSDVWTGLDPRVDMGHVHLHVSNLKRSEDFYCDRLGLEVTQRTYPGALFMSVGGYHHHVAVNTWGGRELPQPGETGLLSFALSMENTVSAVDSSVSDPDGIGIIISQGS